MKIDNSSKPTLTPVGNLPQAKPLASPPPPSDAVSLSSLAGTLQSKDQMPVNSAKVQEIKEAIAQGKFKINPEAIAGSLIETARDLLNSQRNA